MKAIPSQNQKSQHSSSERETNRNTSSDGISLWPPSALPEGIQRSMPAVSQHHIQQTNLTVQLNGEAPPDNLAAYPEAERRLIQVRTNRLDERPQGIIEALFSPDYDGGRHSLSHIVFNQNISESLHQQLTNLAFVLIHRLTPSILIPHSTITVVISSLNAAFRFTRLNFGSGRAQQPVTLVEPADIVQSTHNAQDQEARFSQFQLRTIGNWEAHERVALFAAIAIIPDRAIRRGVSFNRQRGNSPDGGEPGHYDQGNNTITLYNDAFSQGINLAEQLARYVAHEMAHAEEYEELDTAWNTFDAAGQAAAASRRLLRARSRSGVRWHEVQTPNESTGQTDTSYATHEPVGGFNLPFRRAARRDGVRLQPDDEPRITDAGTTATLQNAPTDYGNTNWEELYAEAFSLYITQPDTLAQIRPHIYEYFYDEFGQLPTPVEQVDSSREEPN